MSGDANALIEGALEGRQADLARLISWVEDRRPGYREVLSRLYPRTGRARIIGLTGPPGAGKSTLVDHLARRLRTEGRTVGVVAVDPGSPLTGGALLGDRVRMRDGSGEQGLFFRSMSTRGRPGGLARATTDVIDLLDAAGFDVILVETVGAGQNELQVVSAADTVVLVMTPAAGDDVQVLKAGILEIADVFVVNKSDLEGADRLASDLESLIRRSGEDPGGENQRVPVLKANARRGEGVDRLWDALEAHARRLSGSEEGKRRRRRRREQQLVRVLRSQTEERVQDLLEESRRYPQILERVVEGELDPYSAVDDLLSRVVRIQPAADPDVVP